MGISYQFHNDIHDLYHNQSENVSLAMSVISEACAAFNYCNLRNDIESGGLYII